jgi:hypothetical protein
MPLPIEATTLADRLGLSAATRDNRVLLESAIGDAVADVEAYLGRAVMPRQFTETHRVPSSFDGGWNLTPLEEPVVTIDTITAETVGDPPVPTGYFTIVYTAGLDCRDPDKAPILRYITAHAENSPAVTRLFQTTSPQGRTISSASTTGQSVTYTPTTLGGGGPAGSGAPGALPTLTSLDRWRLAGRRVFQRAGTADVWPYSDPWPYAWPGY